MSTTVTRAAMNRAEAFLHLRRLGLPAMASDRAIQGADAAGVQVDGAGILLAAEVPGTVGWPASGLYRVDSVPA